MPATIILFVIMAAAFWFLIVRPQRKRMLEHQALVTSLQIGDEILSSGGVYGTVRAIHDDDTIELEVADNVVVTLTKGAIASRTDDSAATDASGHDEVDGSGSDHE